MMYQDLYKQGCERLARAGIEEAKLDARLLLEYVCSTNRNDLLVRGQQEVTPEKEEEYRCLLERRALRIPLQQLTGTQEFMGLSFEVNEHVLIPRQDTEILVEEVLRELQDGMSVLDMCTGSGCILISLLYYTNGCRGVGVDISEEALAVAKQNAGRIFHERKPSLFADMGADGESADITFVESDLFAKITEKYDFIVSNPPYIRSDVIETLMPEVRVYEPRLALDGREDGLYFYRRIVEDSKVHLNRGGRLYFEIGYDQAEQVSGLMRQAGFEDIDVVKDFAGLDRVVYGTWIDSRR